MVLKLIYLVQETVYTSKGRDVLTGFDLFDWQALFMIRMMTMEMNRILSLHYAKITGFTNILSTDP